MDNLVFRLRVDIGQRTFGQLAQEREAAASEIERLMRQLTDTRTDSRDANALSAKPGPIPTGHKPSGRIPWNERALLRLRDVSEIVGLSRSAIYNRIADGTFPRPVKLGENTVRWKSGDIQDWLANLHLPPGGTEGVKREG